MKTIRDFILVEEAKIEERKSEGGIILSQDRIDYSKPVKGKVLSIGSEVKEVSVGNTIYYMPKVGVELDPKMLSKPKEGCVYRTDRRLLRLFLGNFGVPFCTLRDRDVGHS